MSLAIQKTTSGDCVVFLPAGEVDLSSSPDLRKALLAAAKEDCKTIAVNLAGVEYMDSSGVAVLIEGLKASQEESKAFTLVAPSRQVTKVLQLSRLDSVFDIRESL
jgi:anti-sigma B factor antagonist